MSVFSQRALDCPACGHVNVETVALSLHGPRVPEVVDRIRQGTFQLLTCAGCGVAYRADGPVMYVDFDQRHWIGEFPRSWEDRWASVELQPLDSFRRAMIDLAPAFLRNEAGGFAIRAVFGLDALAEKIVLLEAGLDDCAVEAVKLQVALRAGAVLHPAFRPRVASTDGTSLDLVVWRRPARAEAPERAVVRLGVDQVTSIRDDATWAPVIAQLSVGPYVDMGRLMLDGRAGERAPIA
jgi:hypothetical protein